MGFIAAVFRLFVTFMLVTFVWSLARRAFGTLARPTQRSQRRPGPPPDAAAGPQQGRPEPRRAPQLDPKIEDADYEELP